MTKVNAEIKKQHFYSWLFSILVILLPVLSQVELAGLDLDIYAMLLLLVVYMIKQRGVFQIQRARKDFAIILFYIIIITVINIIFGTLYSEVLDIILRMGKYIVYMLIIVFLIADSVLYEDYMKAFRIFCYAAFIFLAIQVVTYYIGGVSIMPVGGNEEVSEGLARFRAFFSEPASLAYSVVPFIACSLFGDKYSKFDTRILDAILMSIAVIISTSGQGIICVAVVWTVWTFMVTFSKHSGIVKFFILLLIAAIVLIIEEIGYFDFSIGRLTVEDGAVAARTTGYLSLGMLSPLQLLFGTGFGNYIVSNNYLINTVYDSVYYPAVAGVLFTTGIIGFILYLVFFGRQFKYGNKRTRIICLVILVFAAGGDPLTACVFPSYYFAMRSKDKIKEDMQIQEISSENTIMQVDK